MWKHLFVSVLLTFIILCDCEVVVYVDSRIGNDEVCRVNTSTPCKSLGSSLGRVLDLLSQDNHTTHGVLLLSNGVYLLTEEFRMQESTMVSVRIEAVSTHGAVVRCERDGSGIAAFGSVNITIVGVVIENCGPRSTGLALNGSESLLLQDCIFRYKRFVCVE